MLDFFKKNKKPEWFGKIKNTLSVKSENSIANQASEKVERLETTIPKLKPISPNTTNEILTISKLYHEHPNVSDEFVEKMNVFLAKVGIQNENEYDLKKESLFLEDRDIYLYFDFTHALTQSKIKFPQDISLLVALTSYWIENANTFGLLNFSLIFDALVISTENLDRKIEIAKYLLAYPETVLCASYYLTNKFTNDKNTLNNIFFEEYKVNTNIHVKTCILHFLSLEPDKINSELKLKLILNAKNDLGILSQYRMNQIVFSLNRSEFDPKKLSNQDIINFFDLLHILAVDGPRSGLTINENLLHIFNDIFDEIIEREANQKEFFPIFFYKPFISLLNFYKDSVKDKLNESDKELLQNLLNKIFDKFKIREENPVEIDKYLPFIGTHKFSEQHEGIEIHFFEDANGKLLTVYPIIKDPVKAA